MTKDIRVEPLAPIRTVTIAPPGPEMQAVPDQLVRARGGSELAWAADASQAEDAGSNRVGKQNGPPTLGHANE